MITRTIGNLIARKLMQSFEKTLTITVTAARFHLLSKPHDTVKGSSCAF